VYNTTCRLDNGSVIHVLTTDSAPFRVGLQGMVFVAARVRIITLISLSVQHVKPVGRYVCPVVSSRLEKGSPPVNVSCRV
jgi:hypothetical protein